MVDLALQQSRNNFANAFQQRIAPMTGRTYTPVQNYKAPSPHVAEQVLERLTVLAKQKKATSKSSTAAATKKKKKTGTNNLLKLLSDAPSATSFKEMTKKEKEAYLKSVDPKEASAALEGLFHEGGWQDKVQGAAEGAVTKTLDIISRPAFAEFSGLTNAAKAMNAGQDPWETVDELASGTFKGIRGKQHSGFGDVWNQMTMPVDQTQRTKWGDVALSGTGNNPIRAAQTARAISEANPDMPFVTGYSKNLNRAAGAAGDIGFDPLNAAHGTAATIERATGDIVAKDVIKKSAGDLAQTAVKRHFLANGEKAGKTDRIAKAVADRVSNTVDNIAPQVRGGAHDGTTLFGGQTFAPTVAGHATDEASRQLLDPFERYAKLFDAGKLNTTAKLNTAMKNPVFKRFYDEALDIMSDPAFKGTWNDAINQAKQTARASIDDVLKDVNDEIFTGMRDAFYNAPGVKVFGKKIPFKRIGRAYNAKVTNMPWEEVRNLSHAAQNPGRLANLNNAARSLGLRRFSKEAKEITAMARQFSRAEREELSRMIFSNTVPADPKMEQAFKFLKNKYSQVLSEELDMGVRGPKAPVADNYQYMWMKGSDSKVAAFKKARKEALRDPANNNQLIHGIDEAVAAGVRPEKDAFKNLQYRMAKSQRDMTRSYFNTSLLDDYGFQGKKLTPKQAAERNLVEVKGGFAPGDTTLPKSKAHPTVPHDESWYLPKEINDVLEKFKKMSSMSVSSPETKQLLKVYDWFLNKFKYAVTVAYPGFHVRNSIGDIFFGLLDGVGLQDYKAIAQKFENRFPEMFGKVGVSPKFSTIRIGAQDMKFDEVWELYQTHAASGGFFHSDLGEQVIGGGGNPVTKLGSKVNQGLRQGSEAREDLMRFTHFVKALQTEAAKGAPLKEALDSAAWRVNKYHFDYGALTPLEKTGVKRVVPFYTFMRKAIPTLLESMYMNPRWLSVLNRAQQKTHDSEFFSPLRVPQWQLDAGTTNLTPGEEEPWMMDSGLFPTGSLDILNQTTAQGLAQQVVGQTAPMVKAPFEIATGRSTFNAAPAMTQGGQLPGTDLKTNALSEYMLNTFVPPARSAKNLTDGSYGSFNEFLLGDRLGLGLGIRKLRKETQNTTLRHNMNAMSDKVSSTLNPGLEKLGLKVYFSNRKDGATFRVKNTKNNDIVFDGTLEELIPMVENISKQQGG